MSKITFRADEDLVERVDQLDASKSEVMRAALRAYLDGDDADGTAGRAGATAPGGRPLGEGSSLDALVAERVDAMVSRRIEAIADRLAHTSERARADDINITLALDGVTASEASLREATARRSPPEAADASDAAAESAEAAKSTEQADPAEPAEPPAGGAGGVATAGTARQCGQCGETVAPEHVFCPNCGEKASRRVFCDCGDEVRTDWSFCPSCGRRTPAADVLDRP